MFTWNKDLATLDIQTNCTGTYLLKHIYMDKHFLKIISYILVYISVYFVCNDFISNKTYFLVYDVEVHTSVYKNVH